MNFAGLGNIAGAVKGVADKVVRVADALQEPGAATTSAPAPTAPAPKVGLAAMFDGNFLGLPKWLWAVGVPLSFVLWRVGRRKGGQ
jgi:hypothetical protein